MGAGCPHKVMASSLFQSLAPKPQSPSQYYHWQYHRKQYRAKAAAAPTCQCTISSPYEDSLLTLRIALDADEEEEKSKDYVDYGDIYRGET